MSEEGNEERGRLSVRGLPEDQKEAVRREQNRMCAQRFREKRRDEYRQLCASFIASSNQVKALEKRIEELVKLLQDNGIAVPHNTTDLVQENISDGADDDAPDNEKIFEEMMQVIDKVDSNETEDD